MGIRNHKLVDRKQMPDILRVGAGDMRKEVKEGTYVRLKRGEYKDDVALVDYMKISKIYL